LTPGKREVFLVVSELQPVGLTLQASSTCWTTKLWRSWGDTDFMGVLISKNIPINKSYSEAGRKKKPTEL